MVPALDPNPRGKACDASIAIKPVQKRGVPFWIFQRINCVIQLFSTIYMVESWK